MPDTTELLRVWEQGMGASAASRALMLAQAATSEDAEVLARWNIGRRDRLLLNLRDALFGPDIHCLTDCTNCGEPVELDFRVGDVHVPHGEAGRTHEILADGHEVKFRLPDSTDLLALEGCDSAEAERLLLARCVVGARVGARGIEPGQLPETVVSAMDRRMSEIDPQAEILLEVACPACAAVSPAPFDIVSHLWAELDAWARRMLREVHALAAIYGWSEADILRMSAARRRAYLDLVGA